MQIEEEEFAEELRLARVMKDEYCEASAAGRYQELEPKCAAKILHQIGLIYKRHSPNKIALVQSVGLLNAAIVRNPSNAFQIKKDLSILCKHILIEAKAKMPNADLMKKASDVKNLVVHLRKEVSQRLNPTKVISDIDFLSSQESQIQKTKQIMDIMQLNDYIADKYKEIMAELSQFCENIMGKPPCKYVIAGMGSLARCEITPYSDFEHIILLSEQKDCDSHLEYFQWCSVIFHTLILNLQETLIPSLHIHSFNDKDSELGDWYFDAYTPRGIAFDGMMPHACKFPLGRTKHTPAKPFKTELIKPVGKMLDYLSSEENLKNGYHLVDILTKTCFVFGNDTILNQFQNGVDKYLGVKPKQQRIREVKQQVKDDLDNFSARFQLAKLKAKDSINIKQLIYRSSTLFISALGRIHNISEESSFHIVNKMEKTKIITSNTKNKLSYAIAIACEIRLRVCMENKSQVDDIISLESNVQNTEIVLKIAGATTTISYFQITYCLQCEVAKQLNFTKLHFYSDPLLINFTIGFVFGMKDLGSHLKINCLKVVWSLSEFDFDVCIEHLEKSVSFDYVADMKNTSMHTNLKKSLANYLLSTNIFDEALEFYQQLLADYKMKLKDESLTMITAHNPDFALTLYRIGLCFLGMYQYENALIHFKQSLQIYKSLSPRRRQAVYLAGAHNNIGLCLKGMHQYDGALDHLKQSLEIYKNLSSDQRKDCDVARALNNIGICLKNMYQHENALVCLKQSLKIKKNVSLDQWKDVDVAKTLNNIGVCLKCLGYFDDSLNYMVQSLEIYKHISFNQKKDPKIASTLNNIGLCLKGMDQYDNALICLKESIEIKRGLSLDQGKDRQLAGTLNNTGCCLMAIYQYHDALFYFTQSLSIYQNFSETDQVTKIRNRIDQCYEKIRNRVDTSFNI